MQIELVAFWGFICLILIALAELRADFRMLGIIGCILLVPLALWISSGGIEIQTGTTTTINTTTNTTLTNSVQTGTKDIVLNKAPISLPYAGMAQLLALLLLGSAIYGTFHYASVLQAPRTYYTES